MLKLVERPLYPKNDCQGGFCWLQSWHVGVMLDRDLSGLFIGRLQITLILHRSRLSAKDQDAFLAKMRSL